MTADRARRGPVLLATLAAVLALLLISVPMVSSPARADNPAYASLELTEITPTVVTASTGDTVTVAGTVTNTFDRPISGLQVRLQLGDRITEAIGLRTSLMEATGTYGTVTSVESITSRLAPGARADFRIEVPINGPGGLGIGAAGVYPLMVNVTGTPEYGGPVQIASSRTLLPVLSLPPDAARATDPLAAGDESTGLVGRDGSIAANTSDPAALTVLWPLAAPPQVMPGSLGGGTEDLRLTTDSLATDLKPDGRLGAQLSVLTSLATMDQGIDDGEDGDEDAGGSSSAAPSTTTRRPAGPISPDEKVRDGLCVAVDPDLLSTVEQMTDGYRVMKKADDPGSGTVAGTGKEAAADWLESLRTVARTTCIVALPFAQAGLDSLSLIGDQELASSAVRDPADLVDSILRTTSVRGLTVPAVGTLSAAGRDLLGDLDVNAAAVASSALEVAPDRTTRAGRYRSGDVRLQTYQAPITAALGGLGSSPVVPAIMPAWQRPDLSGESALSRRQSASAAMTFPMLSTGSQVADDDAATAGPVTGRSALLMPPTYWSPTVADAQALLDTASLMIASGVARELPLTTLIEDLGHASRPAALTTPGDVEPLMAQGFPVSSEQAGRARSNLELSWQLQTSLVDEPDGVTSPETYLTPLRQDVLRAVSTPEGIDLDRARAQRSLRLDTVTATLDKMRTAVGILDPGGRYTLASERSPLLLVVRNDLALPVRVRLNVTAPEALEVGDVGVVEIPPKGTRQLQLPTHASSSERATVRISLVTSTGVTLSEPIELSVYSNAYGKALFWITIAAGIVLVLLTARRLWHRFRGEPDPADEDRPEPDEADLLAASAPYEQRLEVVREEQLRDEDAGVGRPSPEPSARDADAPGTDAPGADGPASSGSDDDRENS
ncbi:DUF6049 family protein [Gordonia sp. VNK21]|uniref:DUF6049 family protein n=1 Tax=Gordonia sp. VNK21 TaxID=3382483 RepID=UPI0038D38E82